MMELNTQKMEDFKGRYKYLVVFVGLAFFLIFIRLWSLHVIQGSELRHLSENNRIRLLENPADRGMLLDRKGRILAHNRPSFEVYLVPEDVQANPEVLAQNCRDVEYDPGRDRGENQSPKATGALQTGEDQIGYRLE